MINEGDLATLNQLTKTLEDSYERLSKAYERKNSEEFNKLKRLVIQTQRKISEIVK